MSDAKVLAPDARLRAPKRALPLGTVDCHAHIFDRFERYPLAGGRKYSPPLCTRDAWVPSSAPQSWSAPGLSFQIAIRARATHGMAFSSSVDSFQARGQSN